MPSNPKELRNVIKDVTFFTSPSGLLAAQCTPSQLAKITGIPENEWGIDVSGESASAIIFEDGRINLSSSDDDVIFDVAKEAPTVGRRVRFLFAEKERLSGGLLGRFRAGRS